MPGARVPEMGDAVILKDPFCGGSIASPRERPRFRPGGAFLFSFQRIDELVLPFLALTLEQLPE